MTKLTMREHWLSTRPCVPYYAHERASDACNRSRYISGRLKAMTSMLPLHGNERTRSPQHLNRLRCRPAVFQLTVHEGFSYRYI